MVVIGCRVDPSRQKKVDRSEKGHRNRECVWVKIVRKHDSDFNDYSYSYYFPGPTRKIYWDPEKGASDSEK